MSKHRPIDRTRWQASQAKTIARWKKRSPNVDREEQEKNLLPILLRYADDYPEDGHILEIGCGPICLSQYLPQEHKTYLDPLIDDFRRQFPGMLPEGELLAATAERINKPAESFDMVICLNTISFSLNPELVMHEIERVLKPGGTLIVDMRTHSPLEARLHYWAEQLFPYFCTKTRPYYYSLRGIRRTLNRHFIIKEEIKQHKPKLWIPFFKREQMMFICAPSERKTEAARAEGNNVEISSVTAQPA